MSYNGKLLQACSSLLVLFEKEIPVRWLLVNDLSGEVSLQLH